MPYNGKTDWQYDDTVTETDLNRIEQGIEDAYTAIDNIHIEDGSLTQKGIVQLTNDTESTSQTLVPTAAALSDALQQAKDYADNEIGAIPGASTAAAGIVQLYNGVNSTSQTLAATANALRTVNESVLTKADGSALTTHINNATPHVSSTDRTNWNGKRDVNSNMLPNSTGWLGFTGWQIANGESGWEATRQGYDVPGYFAFSAASGVNYRYIESDWMPVAAGAQFTVAAEFFTISSAAFDSYMEVIPGANGVVGTNMGTISGDANQSWHRKSGVFTQPANHNQVKVRYVIQPNRAAVFRGIARIGVFIGSTVRTWNCDSDSIALFQLSSDQKTKWASAVTGKGGTASSSMTSDQLFLATIGLTFRHANLNDAHSVLVSSQTQPQTYTKTAATIPANCMRCYLYGNGSFYAENTNQRIEQWIDFVDSNGVVASGPYHQWQGISDPGEVFTTIRFDKLNNQITWVQNGTNRNSTIPSNFNVNSSYTIRFRMYYPANAGGGGVASMIRMPNYELMYM